MAIMTAARPTSECMKATISGIDVIGTRRAMTAPIAPPTAMPATINTQLVVTASVVATAIAIPITPKRLPRRAEMGEESPLSARIKNTDATR